MLKVARSRGLGQQVTVALHRVAPSFCCFFVRLGFDMWVSETRGTFLGSLLYKGFLLFAGLCSGPFTRNQYFR